MKNVLILSGFLILLSSAFTTISAQCPVSNEPGIHVVQAGESMYQLTKKYGVSLAQLCEWNNMTINDVIPLCKRLRVAPPGTAMAEKAPATSTVTSGKSTSYVKPFAEYRKQSGDNHVVDYGETFENIARLYGYTIEKFREFNQLSPTDVPYAGQVLSTCHCSNKEKTSIPDSYNSGATSTPKTNSSDTTDPFEMEEKSKAATQTVPYKTTKANAGFMTNEELQMVDEINLVRSNPAGYVPYVQAYIDRALANGETGSSISTAYELMDELKTLAPLSILQPAECIYRAAKKHGDLQKPTGDVNHEGTDGSWPWDRVLRECPQMQDGNENIVGGPSDIRDAVMLLLIDSGIDNRGHRRNLLDPKWQYIACYKIGQVGSMPNNWLQNFGY
jgi:LysM repeat protein/uncharacterized protein YkwD